MTSRKAPPKAWKPGQSGNPAGRKPGTGKVEKLRLAIGAHLPDIISAMVAQAKSGDPAAARLLLERVCPALKPAEQAITLSLPDGTLTEQGRALLAAVGAGVLAPGQGAALLSGIGTLARVVELDELARRVAALEGKGGPDDETL